MPIKLRRTTTSDLLCKCTFVFLSLLNVVDRMRYTAWAARVKQNGFATSFPARRRSRRTDIDMALQVDDERVEVGRAAREGDIDAVKLWLATGGRPTAITSIRGNDISLLQAACASSRPACAAVVELLCEAGARPNQEGYSRADYLADRDEGYCIRVASKYGAVETVRVLLRLGAKVNYARVGSRSPNKYSALHEAVAANRWNQYRDPWSREQARQNAASVGHQGLVRVLLKHGAAVNAFSSSRRGRASRSLWSLPAR